jgi:hypothetical protein
VVAHEKDQKARHLAAASSRQKRPTSEMRRTASATGTGPGTGTSSPHPKFNYFMTPPLSRTSSQMASSAPGTPHYGSDVWLPTPGSDIQEEWSDTVMVVQLEDDIDRASSLMALHEIRTKLKQQDNSGLIKAREKINALAARQAAREKEAKKEAERAAKAKYTYPK